MMIAFNANVNDFGVCMFYKKKGMTGISLVMYAVIGLIIITVVVFMVGNKIGDFVSGKEDAISCKSACNSIGFDSAWDLYTKEECEDKNNDPNVNKRWEYASMHGTYSDVSNGNACCCRKNK